MPFIIIVFFLSVVCLVRLDIYDSMLEHIWHTTQNKTDIFIFLLDFIGLSF